MAVELEHPFSTAKPIDESFAAILDLERVVPCVEGGSVLETTGPNSVKAEIKVKMGAMSMTFTGTVEIVEQDPAAHRVVMSVKSKEAGGQGHANANVVFSLTDGGGTIQTNAQITGKAASMGEGVVVGVLDALITDFSGKLAADLSSSMATITMREVREGEVPFDGGTAIQEDAGPARLPRQRPGRLRLRHVRQRPGRGDAAGADDEEGPRPLRAVRDGQRFGHRRVRSARPLSQEPEERQE